MSDKPPREVPPAPARVERRVSDSSDPLPGERDALRPGSLPQPGAREPHGDENRQPTKPPMPPP